MAGASSKEQWKLVDDQFLDSQGAIDDLRCWATAYVEELSLKRNLANDTAAWILHSMDTPTLFRFYKRKKFSIPATQDALKKNINWRLDTIPGLPAPSPSPLMRFMPEDATDHFGRPILVLRTRYLSGQTVEGLKNQVLSMYELARLHIADLFQNGEIEGRRVLQLVVIIDLKGLAIRDVPMDMMTWFANIPIVHYPGMCAACYILNFSWAFNGMWSIVKRLLPQRAIARIFFPKGSELLEFLPKSSVFQEYEGDLPPFDEKRDPLIRRYLSTSPEDSSSSDESSLASSTTAVTSTSYTEAPTKCTDLISDSKSLPPPDLPVVILPARSPHNPFFGYPVQLGSSSKSIPQLSYGRRRKRDLARTLLILYLRRISLVLQRSLLSLVPFLKQKAQAPTYYYYYDYTEGRPRARGGTTVSLWFWWSIVAWVAGSFGRAVFVLKSEGISSGQAIVMTLKDMTPILMDAIGLGSRLTSPLVAC